MAYTIYIERHAEEPILSDDWQQAVQNADAFRLQQSGTLTITNPQTGESISRPLHENDAEYYDPTTDEWVVALFWSAEDGRASTRAPRDFEAPNNAYRKALVALATALGASVLGQEGELYSD